jgi:hypothetical protein
VETNSDVAFLLRVGHSARDVVEQITCKPLTILKSVTIGVNTVIEMYFGTNKVEVQNIKTFVF